MERTISTKVSMLATLNAKVKNIKNTSSHCIIRKAPKHETRTFYKKKTSKRDDYPFRSIKIARLLVFSLERLMRHRAVEYVTCSYDDSCVVFFYVCE